MNGLQFNASKGLTARHSLLVGGDMYFESPRRTRST